MSTFSLAIFLLVVGATGHRVLNQLPGVPLPASFVAKPLTCEASGPFPYFVSLRNADGSPYCGGVLVSEDSVLTSAACVDPMAMPAAVAAPQLFIGGFDIFNPIEIKSTLETIIHPLWNGDRTNGYDIAILKMDSPTCVKFIPGLSSFPPQGSTQIFMGFGRSGSSEPFSTDLLAGDFTVQSLNTCKENNALPQGLVTGFNFCVSSSKGTGGICEGDEGGPLVDRPSFFEFQDKITGIASYVSGSGNCSSTATFGVFTSVNTFYSWIQSQIA